MNQHGGASGGFTSFGGPPVTAFGRAARITSLSTASVNAGGRCDNGDYKQRDTAVRKLEALFMLRKSMVPNVFHWIKTPLCHLGYFDTAPTYSRTCIRISKVLLRNY
jgi:hypothetical protein